MAITVKPFSIDQLVARLEAEEGFSFARYGDGTFLCLKGMGGKNCDGASLGWAQAAGLEESIRDQSITHGIGDLAIKVGAAEWLAEKGIETVWYDANVMNTASLTGKLYPLVKWLQKRKIVLVGPSHLTKMRGFPVQVYVVTHPTRAWEQLDGIKTTVLNGIAAGADTVLLSTGPSTPTLVSQLHQLAPTATVIDTGSVWDPYVGVYSRKVHKRMGQHRIISLGKDNFRQNILAW